MDPGAQIRLLCIAIDPAFRTITPSFKIINAPGQRTLLGSNTLHIHLTWHINSADSAFNPNQVDWFATFKLQDTGSTGYADSDPFTFHFTNAACPFGDVNDDGVIDGRDIQAFVTVFLDPGSATDRQRCLADCDRDCSLTLADIPAFVGKLLSP